MGGSDTTIRHNTKIHITQNINHAKNKAHKATQTIMGTLHTVNTKQKSKAIPVTGLGCL
jgi:hypothetical protein